MKKLKLALANLPDVYLILLTFAAGYKPYFSINPIALGLVAILILQLVIKNKIMGFIIASLFFLINIYMPFALIHELTEFPTFNSGAKKMIWTGLLIFGVNMLMFGLMVFNYLTKRQPSTVKAKYC